MSDESGRTQVYVTTFPTAGAKTAVSTEGGSYARWRRDGRELYFISGDRNLMAVPIDASGMPGPARVLFNAVGWQDYDVARDGRIVAVIVNWRGR